MKHFLTFLLSLLALWLIPLSAQPYRYLEPVFDEVEFMPDIPYAVNATVLYSPITGEAIPEVLSLDVYAPAGDTKAERPLIIYFHSGNFLPHPQNQIAAGTRRDSSTVAMCRYLASTGFVVASADYRLGWNPIADNQFARIFGIINAAYRGVQDANTCIRFFKMTAVEQGNPFGIDTSRIILWGEDTGGYLATHASALDRWEKITWNPQFVVAPGLYMIMEYLNGDPEGKQYGINDPPSPLLPFPQGDTLNYPNHVGYSSAFCMSVSMGGAVADTAWIEPGQPPIVTVHEPRDISTPYNCDLVTLQTGVEEIPIIVVCGSEAIAQKSNEIGRLQDAEPAEYMIPFHFTMTEVAMSRTGGLAGLLPVIGDTTSDSAPWEFWDPMNANHHNSIENNPNMSREKALLYQDSILAYALPRIYHYCRLGIINVLEADQIGYEVFPNPVSETLHIRYDAEQVTLRELRLLDITGRLVAVDRRAGTALTLPDLPPGLYVLQARFEEGMSNRMVMIN